MLKAILILTFVILCGAMILSILKLRLGPTIMDRIIIFDLFTSIAIGLMAVGSLWLETSFLLDIALLLSLVVFVGTIALARRLESSSEEAG